MFAILLRTIARIIAPLQGARSFHGGLGLLLLSATVVSAWPQSSSAVAPQAGSSATDAPYSIYLPNITVSGSPTTPPPPPDPQTSGFFVEPQKKTSRPGLVIDVQGGMHMAYRYHVPYAEHPQVVYAYCPPPTSQCSDSTKWGRIAFLDRAEEVQIELTPAGQPRLLAMLGDAENSFGAVFVYAECNANCLSEDSWSGLEVQTRNDSLGRSFEYYTPKRYFELDPQGRPRFVYYDYNYSIEPDHIGGFYLWCDANCTEPGTWNEVMFTKQSGYNYESISEPVLKFTRDGRPRVLSYLNPLGNGANGSPLRFELYYSGCDSDCEYGENWQRIALIERGSGYQPAWDLELDPATDNPRAVNYQSGEDKLFYHSCDANCFSEGSWKTLAMDLGSGWGIGVDLKLDTQGRPRLVFLNTSQGVGSAFCSSNCDQLASWNGQLIETKDDIDSAYPVARPVTCNNGLWDIYSPSVAFDSASNVHIIYDASYKARCQYVDPTQPAPPTDVFHEIWHSVRYVAVKIG